MHLYLHIPFCRQACHYCDFHFSTNLSQKSALVDALCAEIRLQKAYLPNQELETIYFGGGTPSLLTERELEQIFAAIYSQFSVSPTAEITLEANPDDLSAATLTLLSRYVNRLSIGIQTFDETALRWMNRAHTAVEAETCVGLAREAGFDNMSVDLIYGIPYRDASRWQTDLQKILALDVPHLSAYALTIEPDTAFGRWQQKGKLPAIDEDLAADQFEELVKTLKKSSYTHYEISNFAKSGQYARHNTAYWQRKPYLGIGPSAHSYNGSSRQHNVANNARYIASIQQGIIPAEIEQLTTANQVNDYLLTGLQNAMGLHTCRPESAAWQRLCANPGPSHSDPVCIGLACSPDGTCLRLSEAGKLFADRVAAALFVDE